MPRQQTPENHCNHAVLRVNKMVAGEFVDTALQDVPDSPPPTDAHEEALSTNTENHWNQAVARVSRTVRAACVCMASSHTSNARPSVWRQAFVDVGGEDRIRYAASHPSRRAATRSVSVLPAGFEGGPSRASPIPHTTHPKQRCCAQNAF